jgi:hypothetical protein
MIFDSMFNSYRGVVAYVRVMNGTMKKGDKIKFINTGKEVVAEEVGVLRMGQFEPTEIGTGDVGYVITGIKVSREIKVGDTITHVARPCKGVKGFEEVKPMVFAGVYPLDNDDFEDLRDRWKNSNSTTPPSCSNLRPRRARLWFPLRLPGHAAPRNRAGTPPPRVRPGHHHHGAQRALLRHRYERQHVHGAPTHGTARPQPPVSVRRALHLRPDHYQAGIHRQYHDPLPRKTRHPQNNIT